MHPRNPNVVHFSTNADPKPGEPLISAADNQRHWELFQGVTADGGVSWTLAALTANSTQDNLRPLVPIADPGRTVLLWLRGTYRTYQRYDTEVVGLLGEEDLP